MFLLGIFLCLRRRTFPAGKVSKLSGSGKAIAGGNGATVSRKIKKRLEKLNYFLT